MLNVRITRTIKYKLDLMGVQESRWEGGGTEPAREYIFFYRKGKENHELGIGFFVHSDLMSYIILRGRWCHIIVLHVHAPNRG
jgi:hypothetical protein